MVDGYLDVLKEKYGDPTVAEKIAATFEANNKNGKYDSIVDNQEFGHCLSQDLHSLKPFLFIGCFEPVPELNDSDAVSSPEKRLHR